MRCIVRLPYAQHKKVRAECVRALFLCAVEWPITSTGGWPHALLYCALAIHTPRVNQIPRDDPPHIDDQRRGVVGAALPTKEQIWMDFCE